MGYAHTLTQLYVLYGIAGVGAAFIYSGSIATALKWFPDKRGTVSGFITAGFGAGSALFIPIIARAILCPLRGLSETRVSSIPASGRAC